MKNENSILIVTSVVAERDAVVRGLSGGSGMDVIVCGVGPAAAAASTAAALAAKRYDLVVNAGIGGGIAGRTEIGALAVASEIVAADLGAESPDGFIRIDDLGFGHSRFPADPILSRRLTEALRSAGWTAELGAVMTVSTVTGTATTAAERLRRIPNAVAEGMEGYGAASAAFLFGLPVLEIRAISNLIGPRDRESWRIGQALERLASASSILEEVL
jgi:futalosine hydrolase